VHPYSHTLMPLDLAKRMIEQRGADWRIELGPFLEILRGGQHLGSALISDGNVRYLDITKTLAQS
jgi:hypothetical protein